MTSVGRTSPDTRRNDTQRVDAIQSIEPEVDSSPEERAEPDATFGRVDVDRSDYLVAPERLEVDDELRAALGDGVVRAQLSNGDLDRRRVADRTSTPGRENPTQDTRSARENQHLEQKDVGPGQPEPREQHDGAPTAAAEGDLFVDGVDHADVEQGSIANCYFASAMSAVALEHPELIEDAITDNGDGTYDVRFFNDDGEPEYVTVDDELYRNESGGVLYGRGTDRSELWPAILEKGYAEWRGGYDDIGEGGNGAEALRALTGRGATFTRTDVGEPDALFDTLRAGTEGDRPMVANTYGPDFDEMYEDTGVYSWHVYSVLDASEGADGERYVTLRNPWGSHEFAADYETDVDWDGDGVLDGDDGVFRMRLEDFSRLYAGVTVGR